MFGKILVILAGFVVWAAWPQGLWAQAPAPATDALIASPAIASHNAWVLLSTALVFLMAVPGLSLYYGGLVRKKNVLSTMMQALFLMSIMTVIWSLIGYSLAFGGHHGLIGNLDYALCRGVARVWDADSRQSLTPMFNDHLPRMSHMLFQCMFFAIAPAIMAGAFAERMKFSALVWFSILWGLLVYCPLAHWVWGGGILTYGKGLLGGSLDFAGGTVVHISSGTAALVAALVVGPRLGHRQEPMPPHNLTYSTLGTAFLWMGWFGFNSGNALAINSVATSAIVATHFSAAAGAIVWAGCEWWQRAKPSVLGTCSGAVSGLVVISPAAGHVGPMSALIMGAIGAWGCYIACYRLKRTFGYDDALDAFGVHGVGGLIGAMLTGVFATRTIWDIASGNPVGAIDGNWHSLLGQLAGCTVACSYVAVVTFALLKLIDITLGLRVNSTMERQGLDVTQHGEEGYIFL